jgi:hypothetical protein
MCPDLDDADHHGHHEHNHDWGHVPNGSKMGTVTLPPGIHLTSDLSISAEENFEPVIEPPLHSQDEVRGRAPDLFEVVLLLLLRLKTMIFSVSADTACCDFFLKSCV